MAAPGLDLGIAGAPLLAFAVSHCRHDGKTGSGIALKLGAISRF